MHDKKEKGDLAVAQVVARLTELKWNIGILLTEHAKYDLLAERDGKALRVQVKHVCFSKSKKVKSKLLSIPLKHSWADKHGNHMVTRKSNDYDMLAIYCPDNRKCYFLKESDIGNNISAIQLMVEYSSNNIRILKHSKLAKDFETI